MRLYLLGGQQLLENFEGIWAVAAASDLEGGGAEFGVFVGEVGDARGEGQGGQGLVYFWLERREDRALRGGGVRRRGKRDGELVRLVVERMPLKVYRWVR